MSSKHSSLEEAVTIDQQEVSRSGRITNLAYALFLIYITALAWFYLVDGELFQFSLGLIFLAVSSLALLFERWKGFFKESFPFVMLLLSYEALQGIVGETVVSRSILSVYSIDRLLWGFNLTGWVQSQFLSASTTTIALFLYGLHFPLIFGASALFWLTNKAVYRSYLNAMLIVSFGSLIAFVLAPTAPPWYQGTAQNLITNGASSLSNYGNWLTQLIESDKLAAFPSLHSAYATTFSYFAVRLRPFLAVAVVPLVIGIWVAAMYLGQHYLFDLIGGAGLSLLSCHFTGQRLSSKRIEGAEGGS